MPTMPQYRQRFDEAPYALIRTICGFNALIDYLKLDIEKTYRSKSAEVARMIRELTNGETNPGIGIAEQSKQLQQMIDKCIARVEDQLNIIALADLKLQHLRVHGEWS